MDNTEKLPRKATFEEMVIDLLAVDLDASRAKCDALAADNATLTELLHAALDELQKGLVRERRLRDRAVDTHAELRRLRAIVRWTEEAQPDEEPQAA